MGSDFRLEGDYAMNQPAAISAQLVDVRNVGQHKAIKLTLHVPAEQAESVMAAFGWPTMVEPVPVALARLDMNKVSGAIAPEKDGEGAGQSTLAACDVSTPSASRRGEPSKKSWNEMSGAQQAGILCGDPEFWKFLREKRNYICDNADDVAHAVRSLCGVSSRTEILPGTHAERHWRGLVSDYRAWQHEPEYVGELE